MAESMMDEFDNDLHWHALNYRTAATQHAELMWQELVACVERIVSAERERCAHIVETQDTYGDPVGCWFETLAAKIRA